MNTHFIALVGDMHLEQDVPEHSSYKAVKAFIKDIQPLHTVIIGDALDFSYLGYYNEALEELREGKRLKADIDLMNRELDFFQANSQGVSYLEGNHEYRLTRAAQKAPNVLKGLVDLPSLLHLQKRNIRWFPEMNQPVRIFDDLYVIHGKRYNIHYSKKLIEDYGVSVVQGHTHRLQTFAKSFLGGKADVGYGLGCLCDTNPSYTNGYPTGHTNGFGLIETDLDSWTFYNIQVKDGAFLWNGNKYQSAA